MKPKKALVLFLSLMIRRIQRGVNLRNLPTIECIKASFTKGSFSCLVKTMRV